MEEALESGIAQTGIPAFSTRERRRLRVGIQVICDWDDEADEQILLTMEDPTAAPVDMPKSESHGISANQFVEHGGAIFWAVELPSMEFVFVSPQPEKLLGFTPEQWTGDGSKV